MYTKCTTDKIGDILPAGTPQKIAASCQLYICTYYNFTNYFKDKLLTKLDFSPFCVHLQIPVLPRMVELHYIVLNRM